MICNGVKGCCYINCSRHLGLCLLYAYIPIVRNEAAVCLSNTLLCSCLFTDVSELMVHQCHIFCSLMHLLNKLSSIIFKNFIAFTIFSFPSIFLGYDYHKWTQHSCETFDMASSVALYLRMLQASLQDYA